MFKKIISFKNLPNSQKREYLKYVYYKYKTRFFYAKRMKGCGHNVIVFKPLLWTPEFMECESNVRFGSGSRIEAINKYLDNLYTPLLKIGENTSFEQNCHITYLGNLEIGKNVTISFGVSIQDADHNYQDIDVKILRQPLIYKRTKIGDFCFIGSGVKIQPGTILGKQCIVGTNSVVRGVFPDYSVIAGIPARIIKRFDVETSRWRKTNEYGIFIDN